MTLEWVFALFIVFVLAMLALGIWQHLKHRERGRRLEQLAARQGWMYTKKDTRHRHAYYAAWSLFRQGAARTSRNILQGAHKGHPFEIFDYEYTISTGKSSATYYHKVCALRMPLSAPELTIEPERLHHKLFDALGGEDIDFESEAFSKRFWIRSMDRRFAYDVIHAPIMEHLMAHPKYQWDWRGDTMIVYEKGHLSPHDALRLHQVATRFAELLPRHLLAAARPAQWQRIPAGSAP